MNKRISFIPLLLISFFLLGFQPISQISQENQEPSIPPWVESIHLINKMEAQGSISLDKAVRLRLQALRDPFSLPPQFQPSLRFENQLTTRPKCGLPEFTAKNQALFKDYEEWNSETKLFVEQEMKQDENQALSSTQSLRETTHFKIYWDPNEIQDGADYASVLATLLEQAWDIFETDHGYAMPDPSEYYLIIDENVFHLEKFEVRIVNRVTFCFLFPLEATGFALPGRIQFNVNYLDKSETDWMESLTAHELFHLIQWDYIGFRQAQCSGDLSASLFYGTSANRGAWLMEGSSTWIEKLFYQYPIDNDIEDYNSPYPDRSLFLFDDLRTGSNNREYGTALFLWYLESFYSTKYNQPVVKTIWSELDESTLPPLRKDTVDALTDVLLHPDKGSTSYDDYPDLWQSFFADFVLANYLKEDYKDLINRPNVDWGGWPQDADIAVKREERPNLTNSPEVSRTLPPIEDPGSFPIEIYADNLGLPSGEDQTGVILDFSLSTNCPYCAVEHLIYDSPNHTLRSIEEQERRILINSENPTAEFSIEDFGASPNRRSQDTPTASEMVTILFTSGAGGYGGWGYEEFSGAFSFFRYIIQITDNPPIQPQNLSAFTSNGDYPITFQWDEVREEGIRYNLYRGRNEDIPLDDNHRIGENISDPTFILSSGNLGEYYFVVTSVDKGGNESEASHPVKVSILAPTPTPIISSIKIQVDHSNEDAGPLPSSCAYATYWNEIYIGQCDNGTLITSGFRFGDVPIPKGAQIQEAFIEFTTDGPYENIPVLVRINGESSGNAQPFSSTDPPASRPQTLASASWDIPPSDRWELGYTRQSPDLTDIVQEIVSRSDWTPYNGMAFIFKTVSSGTGQHRRVIGFDRIDPYYGYYGTEHAARLMVTYLGPQPSPTQEPTIPPTPTPTPTPTPSCNCPFGCSRTSSLASRSLSSVPSTPGTPQPTSSILSLRIAQAVDLTEFASLLYRVRDEYLAETSEGRRYISVFEEHGREITTLLFNDQDLYEQGYNTMKLFEADLQALVDGEGEMSTITEKQVTAVEDFLDALSAEASPELRIAIRHERERRPLEEMIGMSMAEAWDYVNGYTLTWLPPLSLSDPNPYQVQAKRTLPVQFTLTDLSGEFAEDDTALLQVVNEFGEIVLGPIGLSKNPAQGIMIQDDKYHLNLATKELEPGSYTIEVYFNSIEPGEPARKDFVLKFKEKK